MLRTMRSALELLDSARLGRAAVSAAFAMLSLRKGLPVYPLRARRVFSPLCSGQVHSGPFLLTKPNTSALSRAQCRYALSSSAPEVKPTE